MRAHIVLILLAMFSLRAAAAEQNAEILSRQVVCKEPGRYIGWPTIARTDKGELLTVFSGDREQHVCPFGKVQLVRSSDHGATWSAPQTIQDLPVVDDRDSGILKLSDGSLLVSWFTSTYFADHAAAKWKKESAEVTPEIRKQYLGNWVCLSNDGGKTWGAPIRNALTAPHGPIQLKSGKLLYLGNDSFADDSVKTESSDDGGKTWKICATIPVPEEKKRLKFCEPHLVETASGKIVGMFRVEPNNAAEQFLYQSESKDGGGTWTEPQKTEIWGYPPHLLRLKNGWLLVVYGRRMKPVGERACISRDDGKTWDTTHEITLSGALDGDLGYPASVELEDGSLYTVFYQKDKSNEKTCLIGVHWKIPQ